MSLGDSDWAANLIIALQVFPRALDQLNNRTAGAMQGAMSTYHSLLDANNISFLNPPRTTSRLCFTELESGHEQLDRQIRIASA